MTFKALILATLISGLLYSCTPDTKDASESKQEDTRIEMIEILRSYQNCNKDSVGCTYASIIYPRIPGENSDAINHLIEEDLLQLSSYLELDSSTSMTIENVAEKFVSNFEDFKVDFPDYAFGWIFDLQATQTGHASDYVSIRYDLMTFTGGAHPNTNTQFSIIKISDGSKMELREIISDTTSLKPILEGVFRNNKKIPEGQTLADAGYYIDDLDFPLTQNVGMTQDSIIFYYNAYEIAPYSLGPSKIQLHKDALKGMIAL